MASKIFMARSNVTATENPLASTAGLHAFERGGNAFDAATAASFALAVTEPQRNGLGGDFFALLYNAEHDRIYCLNSSGWSPASASAERLKREGHRSTPTHGHHSVVIPGYVRGAAEMQHRFGTMELAETMSDAIELAEEGFPVGSSLADAIAGTSSSFSKGAGRVFLHANGAPLTAGETLKQKELAARLREIAEDGPDVFYAGAAAKALRAEMSAGGVEVGAEDLSSYKPEWCDPLKTEYHGVDVYEVPPNSMGATALLMLRLLEEGGGVRGLKPNSAERIKRTVAAARVAYAARDAMLGDPRFMKGGFSLEKFLKEGAEGMNAQRTIDGGDTTYFAVGDSDGNLLSCIQSLFHGFGSRVYVEGGGFFLNNRGSSFKLGGRGANVLEPRKRPLHTLSSLILTREKVPFIAVGASGGDYRPQQHALFVTNVADYSMDVARAIDYPRFLWDGGNSLRVEDGYARVETIKMKVVKLPYPGETGVAQGVERMADCVKGVCDIRGEGLPAGN